MHNRNRNQNGNRQSIGDYYVTEACKQLDKACEIEAALFVPQRFTCEQILPWCFTPETLEIAQAAHGIIEPSYSSQEYEIGAGLADQIELQLRFVSEERHNTPTIQPKYFSLQEPQCAPLEDAIVTIRDIYLKWSGVKHMLRWFNRNATPGAIRNYWPAVLKLCKNSPAFKEMFDTAPARFTPPPEIGMMLPLIRETATTVAGMALMPDSVSPHQGGTVQLTFKGTDRCYLGRPIDCDEMTFKL